MKKIYIAIAALMAVALPSVAQDTYEGAKLMNNDLNGTARYVGMGGAMEALGADISVMGSNPAGIGLFRHSTISASMGVVSQQDVTKFDGLNKTNFSFDQAGFVYSTRLGWQSFVNIGVNYHKSHNFDQILSAANSLSNTGASINKVGFYKSEQGSEDRGGYDLDFNEDNDLMGFASPSSDYRAYTFSQVDYLYMNAFNYDPETNAIYFSDADNYQFNRAHRGWISDFDFNISGNINDRVYLGMTIGVHDVNYKAYSEYGEQIAYVDRNMLAGQTLLCDERTIDGTGFDVKAGIVFRPVEYSPFRVGLSVSTPTFYDLKTSNFTRLYYDWSEQINDVIIDNSSTGKTGETYEFKMYTPWKFGVSLGHTVGTTLALGASYEYADYSSTDIRINDVDNYSVWDYDDWQSHSDREMNAHTDHTLKGVHTLKLGAELKPDPAMALRLGYNYVSAMYEKDGVRDATLNSIGVMYSSTTDYVNWGDTQRITCGLGYNHDSWNFDLAYQYSATKGTFYPFQPGLNFNYGGVVDNTPQATKVSNNRHQVMMTIGYTF